MMNSDLVLSDDGGVIFIQDKPYAREIVRAEFYIETGYLIFIYDNEDSRMVEYHFETDDVIEAVKDSPAILLTYIYDGKIQDGFEVPLIAIAP